MADDKHGFIEDMRCIEAQDMPYATRPTVQVEIDPNAETTAITNNIMHKDNRESGSIAMSSPAPTIDPADRHIGVLCFDIGALIKTFQAIDNFLKYCF